MTHLAYVRLKKRLALAIAWLSQALKQAEVATATRMPLVVKPPSADVIGVRYDQRSTAEAIPCASPG